MSNSFDDRATITHESEDGLSRTVYTALLRDSVVRLNRYASTRKTKLHKWTYAPPPPSTPPEVLAELANTLAERVRAATLGAERWPATPASTRTMATSSPSATVRSVCSWTAFSMASCSTASWTARTGY